MQKKKHICSKLAKYLVKYDKINTISFIRINIVFETKKFTNLLIFESK